MKITKAEVLHVAQLARLDIKNEEIDRFADQIGTILEYVDTLKEVDTEGVAATYHAITLTNAFREDEVHEHLEQANALSNAPKENEGAFEVPKIL